MIARIGIDLGGTKIEGVVLAINGTEIVRRRIVTPRDDYAATIAAIKALSAALRCEAACDVVDGIGIGIPGSISARTGRVQNANSTWLNGRELHRDLEVALGSAVFIANDANCFALSEATDGAAAGAASMLGVIIGTGIGSGIVINGRIISGPLGIGGEFGHNPLPWPTPEFGEIPGAKCWCGRNGCIEAWCSGPGLSADHARTTGNLLSAEALALAAVNGDAAARRTMQQHAHRLARALAHAVNMLDPEVIVLGGGLSQIATLYEALPELMTPHIFSDDPIIRIVPPTWGDASGVRGAARLVAIT
jgi:fructokinase